MIRNFKLQESAPGGATVVVPTHAALDFRQSYEPIGGTALLRLNDGKAVKQHHWRKTATSISGSGWLPPGVHALNYAEPILLHCAAPRAITSPSPGISIPGSYRTDVGYFPFGRAFVNGEWVNHTLGVAVPGAAYYQAVYFPILTVYAEPPSETTDAEAAEYAWQITGEEV